MVMSNGADESALERTYSDSRPIDLAIAEKLLQHFSRRPLHEQQPEMPYEKLTQRELQVLQLAADGLSNKEVAANLVISEKTAKNHIANIFSKVQVNDRTQAILYALRKGLITMPPGEAN